MMEGEGGSNKEEAGPSHGGPTWYEEDKRMEEEEEGETEEDDHLQDSAAAAAAVDSTTTFVPGPLLSLKDQIEKDQDDESLRRWKEKLLGCLESDLNGQMEPEVKFHSVGILSSDFGEINTPLPIKEEQSKSVLFTLREGSEYRLKLTFSVLHNIVSGLAYTNTVWKAGLQGVPAQYLSPSWNEGQNTWSPSLWTLSFLWVILLFVAVSFPQEVPSQDIYLTQDIPRRLRVQALETASGRNAR
ncbi:putative phospholipid--sterol O-acyltransferase-like isoform X1 [Capsicum annuum]|nr:putative phospholipid--sterol O-acyltransferase-like isoform X1 [Capsicum annuum]